MINWISASFERLFFPSLFDFFSLIAIAIILKYYKQIKAWQWLGESTYPGENKTSQTREWERASLSLYYALLLIELGVTLVTSGSCLHFPSLHKQKLVNSLPTQIILFFYEISCSLCEMYVTCFLMSPLLPTLSVKRTPVARCSHGRAELGAMLLGMWNHNYRLPLQSPSRRLLLQLKPTVLRVGYLKWSEAIILETV